MRAFERLSACFSGTLLVLTLCVLQGYASDTSPSPALKAESGGASMKREES